LWIHIRGALNSVGDTIEHMGTQLSSYPSLRCHVFSRSACPSKDPVEQVWSRVDNLKGQSVFLGINYPFFVGAPGAVEPVIAQAALAPNAAGGGGVGGGGADEELAAAAPGEADEILGDAAAGEADEILANAAAGEADEIPAEAAAGVQEEHAGVVAEVPALPVLIADCVFAAHSRAYHVDTPDPTWSRIHVGGRGPTIGSSVGSYYLKENERRPNAAFWFVPTIPPAPGT
jgi:hypothetical protein